MNSMCHYLYILRSKKEEKRFYIGITSNIENRLKKHNSGLVRSTKAYRPWDMAMIEEFQIKTDARKKEIHLKRNYQARKEIFDKILQDPIV